MRPTRTRVNKMNKFKFLSILTFAVLMCGAITLSACNETKAQGGNSNVSVRWEYKIIYDHQEEKFNELGREGWEYVGSAFAYNSMHTFKRRLP